MSAFTKPLSEAGSVHGHNVTVAEPMDVAARRAAAIKGPSGVSVHLLNSSSSQFSSSSRLFVGCDVI